MLKRWARRLWVSPTATTWGSLAVRLSAVLLVLPVVLVRFAPPQVALWQLFNTLFMLAMLLDFGLAPTFARLLAFARGGASLADMVDMRKPSGSALQPSDGNAAAEVVSALRWLYPRLGIAVVLVFGVLGTLALQKPVSQTGEPNAAWMAWALVLITTAAGMWGAAYAAALQGMDRIAVMRRWEVATGLCQLVSSVVVLWLGAGLLALVATYQTWVVIGAVRNRYLLRRLHPELFAVTPQPHPGVLRVMWPATWRSGLGVVMSQGLIQLSGVVYSQLAPAHEVAAYLLALRLMTMISQFCQAPFYSKLPRLAELQAAGRRADQLRLAQRGMRLAYWVFVGGSVLAALGVAPLLQSIGSKTGFVSHGVWALLALAFFAERFGAMHLQLYSLTNRIVWHIANGITGLAMIVIATFAYPRIGEYAFPTAMLAAYACFYCVYSAAHTRAAFQLRLLVFESRTALPALAALCAGLGLVLAFPLRF